MKEFSKVTGSAFGDGGSGDSPSIYESDDALICFTHIELSTRIKYFQ